MAANGIEGSATVHIQAPLEKVYALVTDVTRMGEWSPETYKAEWIEGATGPAPGARFKGHNKLGLLRWSTKPTVKAAVPGQEFTFETGKAGKEDTRWCYRLTAKEGGTDLTESFEALRYPAVFKLTNPPKKRTAKLQSDIERTLQRIKAAAEGSA